MLLTEETLAKLKDVINETLDARDAITAHTHSDHHRFVEELIEREHRRMERNERIRQQVIGWGLISAITGAGYGAYHLFVEFVRKVTH